jgi:cathepsin F
LKLLIFYFVIHLCFTAKEFKKYRLGLNTNLKDPNSIPLKEAKIPDVQLPTEFDWRDHGVVTEVKNQVNFSLRYL